MYIGPCEKHVKHMTLHLNITALSEYDLHGTLSQYELHGTRGITTTKSIFTWYIVTV